MNDTWKKLYTVVQDRRVNPQRAHVPAISLRRDWTKVLKKVGEECSETLIAAKNGIQEETVGEISDLLYHLTVLMVEQDIPLEAVMDELDRRSQKIGNLKTFHQSDHES